MARTIGSAAELDQALAEARLRMAQYIDSPDTYARERDAARAEIAALMAEKRRRLA